MSDGLVLVIARNNVHLTKRTVESALAQDMQVTVMVIDNASTDGTCQYLASKRGLSSISYVEQKSLSACWNAGLRAAWATGHGHALVLNNDVEIRPDMYRLLLESRRPFVSGVSVLSSNRLYPDTDKSVFRPHPDFSAFLITKECFDKVGPFDESYYPAYCEDCDYHIRMHRAGVVAGCIDVPFLHHSSSTLKSASPDDRYAIERGAEENRQRFLEKYGCLPGSVEYSAIFTGR
jgi:GT2 family glycosyltransferase